MDTALFAARLLLAAVFASAAVSKLVDPSATAAALAEFRVPRALVRFGTRALPLVELAIAIALIPMATATWAAIAAAVLLAAFSSGVAGVLTRGERVDCNCFGAIRSGPVSRWTLLRDFVLLALAAFVAIAGPGTRGPPRSPGSARLRWRRSPGSCSGRDRPSALGAERRTSTCRRSTADA